MLGILRLVVRCAAAAAATSDEVEASHHIIYTYPGVDPPSQLLDLTKQGARQSGRSVSLLLFGGNNVGDNIT